MTDMTKPKYEFTVEDVAREVRKLAAERPDFVYSRGKLAVCSYAPNPELEAPEGCIVGQALARLGVPVEVLACINGTVSIAIDVLNLRSGPYGGWGWLGRVQSEQDDGTPWGIAVRLADEQYPAVASRHRQADAQATAVQQ